MTSSKTTQTEKSVELPARVQLDEADLRTGIALDQAIAQAQARLQAINDMERLFAEEMHRKYGAPSDQYVLRDWITGLELLADTQAETEAEVEAEVEAEGTEAENG